MTTIEARPAHAVLMNWRLGERPDDPWTVHPRIRRRFASPLLAAMLLTAAIFVLPAAGGRSDAEAAHADGRVSATLMEQDISARTPTVRD